MLKILGRLFLTALLLGCLPTISQAQNDAVVVGQIDSATARAVRIEYKRNHFMLEDGSFETVLDDNNVFSFRVKITESRAINLIHRNESVRLFLTPGDTLKLHFKSKHLLETITFDGSAALHNDYLVKADAQFSETTYDNRAKASLERASAREHAALIDGIYAERKNFFDAYPTSLKANFSNEFLDFVLNDNTYWRGAYLMEYVRKHGLTNPNPDKQVDDTFFNFLFETDNAYHKALNNQNYIKYLDLYLGYIREKSGRGKQTDGDTMEIRNRTVQRIKTKGQNVRILEEPYLKNEIITMLGSGGEVDDQNLVTGEKFKYVYGDTVLEDYFVKVKTLGKGFGWVPQSLIERFDKTVADTIRLRRFCYQPDKEFCGFEDNLTGKVLYFTMTKDILLGFMYDQETYMKQRMNDFISRNSSYDEYNVVLRGAFKNTITDRARGEKGKVSIPASCELERYDRDRAYYATELSRLPLADRQISSRVKIASTLAFATPKGEDKAQAEADAKARQEADAKAKLEAAAKLTADAQAKSDADAKARAADELRLKLEADAKARLVEEERLKIEEENKAKLAETARVKAEADAKAAKITEEARLKAENEAKFAKIAEENKLKAEEEAKAKAAKLAEEARLKADLEAKATKQAEENRLAIEAKRKAEEDAKAAKIAETARLKAEDDAKAAKIAEENRLKAEAKAKADAEEKATKLAEAARLRAEAEAKALKIAEEKAKAEAAAKAAKLAEEARVKADLEAKAAKIAEENRLKAEAKAKAEADAKAAKIAEAARLKAEADAKAAKIAEENRLKAELKAKEEAIAKAAKQAEEARLRAEAEAKAIKLAEEKAKAEAAARTARLAEEARLKADLEAKAAKIAEENRLKAAAKAKAEADAKAAKLAEEARLKAEADAKAAKLAQEARLKAELEAKAAKIAEEARLKAAAKAKAEADAKAFKLAEEARLKAEADAKAAKIAEENRLKAEAKAKADAARVAEEARLKAENEAKALKLAQEKAKAEAAAKAAKLAEEARIKADLEAKALKLAQEKAKAEADAKAAKLAEEARLKAEAEAKAAKIAEENRLKAEAKAKAEEAARLAKLAEEARLKAETVAKAARIAEEERLKAEAIAKAEAKAKADAEAKAARLAEEARIKAELKAKADAEAQAARVAAEAKAKAEAEAKAAKIAEEARQKAEAKAARLAEEARQKAEAEARAAKAAKLAEEKERLEEENRVKLAAAKEKLDKEAQEKLAKRKAELEADPRLNSMQTPTQSGPSRTSVTQNTTQTQGNKPSVAQNTTQPQDKNSPTVEPPKPRSVDSLIKDGRPIFEQNKVTNANGVADPNVIVNDPNDKRPKNPNETRVGNLIYIKQPDGTTKIVQAEGTVAQQEPVKSPTQETQTPSVNPDQTPNSSNIAKGDQPKVRFVAPKGVELDTTQEIIPIMDLVKLDFDPSGQFIEFKGLVPGDEMPRFTLTDINGKTVTQEEMKNKVIFIDFWASWCGPCVAQFSHAKVLMEKYKNQDVLFLFISIDENLDQWKDHLKYNPMAGTHGNDKVILPINFMVSGIPNSFIVSRSGKIAFNSRLKSRIKDDRMIQFLLDSK